MSDWEKDTFLARWLSGELSEEERKSFEASEEYAQFKAITDVLDTVEAPAYDEADAFEQLQNRIEQSKQKQPKVIPLFIRYAVAASIIVAACLAIYVALAGDQVVEITAEAKKDVQLPDGSAIIMQKGSYIQYSEAKWDEGRDVQLKGEAYFEVEKGTSFNVLMENGKVSVLGTSFNILQKDSSLEVSCYTGKVKVEGFGKGQIIEAGQSVTITKNDAIRMQTELLQNPIWIDSIASYKNVKLNEVVQQFSSYYEVSVIGEYDTNLRYTGQFPINDVEVSAEQLFGPFDLSYRLDSNAVYLLNE